jgi:hypothetical protein
MEVQQTIHTRALKRAAEVLGGVEALQARLNVPEARLALWLEGYSGMPTNVFLQVVDILLDHEIQGLAAQSAPSAASAAPKKAPSSVPTPD